MAAKKEPIVIGSDHAGFRLKGVVKKDLEKRGIPFKDVGAFDDDKPSDYPIYSSYVSGAVSAGVHSKGILVCGEGLGSSIVANRYPRVHATLCLNSSMARVGRAKNDSNVLILAQQYTADEHALEILDTWLATPFEGGRHKRRLDLIDDSSHVNLAFRHLNQVDFKKIENSTLNRGFMKRALKGFEQLQKLVLQPERRDDNEDRSVESFPTKFSYDGRKYNATMIDLSSGGAQLMLTQTEEFPPFLRGEKLSLSIKTSYGSSAIDAVIRWIDAQSLLFGVSFPELPKSKKDPLRQALETMF